MNVTESGEIQEIMPGSHPDYDAKPSGDGTLQQSPLGPFVLHTVERAQVSRTNYFAHFH